MDDSDWRPFERSPLARMFRRNRYVMRRKSEGKWVYRACTAEELADINETLNKNRKFDDLRKHEPVDNRPFIVK